MSSGRFKGGGGGVSVVSSTTKQTYWQVSFEVRAEVGASPRWRCSDSALNCPLEHTHTDARTHARTMQPDAQHVQTHGQERIPPPSAYPAGWDKKKNPNRKKNKTKGVTTPTFHFFLVVGGVALR